MTVNRSYKPLNYCGNLDSYFFNPQTPAKSQNQTSSAPWTADPKPLMSAATPYSQRPPQPKPLMPPSGPLSGTQRGPLAGPPGGGAPWSAPPTYDQNQRTNVQRGQLPPWSQGW